MVPLMCSEITTLSATLASANMLHPVPLAAFNHHQSDSDLDDEHGISSTDDDPDHNNFSDMIDTIITAEEPTTSEEADAARWNPFPRDFSPVLACDDRLVILAPQLISISKI